jgi:2-polyprenyl-3-methyl-5-hydroxy-6-metoxy-1,4-benzoquinol methylase
MEENGKQQTENNKFYTSLIEGKVKRDIGGLDKRFSYENIIINPSVQKYLLPFLRDQIKSSDKILDYGCGSGVLIPIISQFCAEVCGFDIVPGFVILAKKLMVEQDIHNAAVYDDAEFNNKFKDNCFDVVIVNDVLHHMDNPSEAIEKIHTLLKPEGRLIIIEPNRFNPAIFISQAAEPNERKWLRMGHFKYYEKIINNGFEIIKKDWFPLVYGPSSKIILLIAEFCENFPFKLLRWSNPRLYLICHVIK